MPGRSLPWTDLDPDRRNTLLLYAAIGTVVAFALALIAFAYYNDRIAPLNDTVLTVGDRKFDYAFFERRSKYEVRLGIFDTSTTISDAVVSIIRQVESEEITRQAAARAGLGVTEAEIDERIRTNMGLPEGVDRNTFAAFYRQAVLRSGLPPREYRDIIAADIARNKLLASYEAEVPEQTEHVDMRLVQLGTQADALRAKERLEAGETFVLVAGSMSTHWSRDQGGELGWVPRGALGPRVEEVAFGLQPGQRSDIIEAPDGFFIVLVNDKAVREVDPQGKLQITQRKLNDTIVQTREAVGSHVTVSEAQIDRIARALLSDESLRRRG